MVPLYYMVTVVKYACFPMECIIIMINSHISGIIMVLKFHSTLKQFETFHQSVGVKMDAEVCFKLLTWDKSLIKHQAVRRTDSGARYVQLSMGETVPTKIHTSHFQALLLSVPNSWSWRRKS